MNDLESMATALEASGDYRVLRRLTPQPPADAAGAEVKLGLVVDCETTGLDPHVDEIIELCMVPFTFTTDGRLIEVLKPFHELREPGRPISQEAQDVTGITAEMVRGHAIDPDAVAAFVAPAVLIVAHHAGFDRPVLERFSPIFATKAWGCSMSQIDWKAEGFDGSRLAYLATSSGFFYDKHRATQDCAALIEMLARPLPRSGVPALAKLLDAARQADIRIWATNAPFKMKDALKGRGYHWNDGADGRAKAWHIDVPEGRADDEIAYLQKEIYQSLGTLDLPKDRITAFSRFSVRP